MKVRIETPVKGYNGFCAGVNIVNGIAEADINEKQWEYFKTAGYSLTLLEMPKLEEKPATSKKRSKKNVK